MAFDILEKGEIITYREEDHDELMAIKPAFTNNQHFWPILKENYGSLKAFAIGRLIPVSYSIANLVCRIGLK